MDDPRLTALRRMKLAATGLLVFAAVVFLIARTFHGDPAIWGYVEAGAEAAMVGALADWFAVTALFRHPLGLPIPHTAIIPERKDEIGRSLGEFVEGNFMSRRDHRRAPARCGHRPPARRLAQPIQAHAARGRGRARRRDEQHARRCSTTTEVQAALEKHGRAAHPIDRGVAAGRPGDRHRRRGRAPRAAVRRGADRHRPLHGGQPRDVPSTGSGRSHRGGCPSRSTTGCSPRSTARCQRFLADVAADPTTRSARPSNSGWSTSPND